MYVPAWKTFSLLEFENGCIGSNNELSTDNAGKATFPFRFSSLVVSLCSRITFLKRPPGLHLMDFSFLVSRHERERERETFPRLIKISFYIFRDSFPSRSLALFLPLIVLFLLKKVNPVLHCLRCRSIFFHAVSRVEATWDEKWRKVYLERSQNVLNVMFFFLRDNNIWRF